MIPIKANFNKRRPIWHGCLTWLSPDERQKASAKVATEEAKQDADWVQSASAEIIDCL